MTLKFIEKEVIACEKCPRLRAYCLEIAKNKRKSYQSETYWGKPVPGFGDSKAKIWIIGLAPAAHGGNRTGRMFTGDRSGEWLYRALFKAGLANQHSWADKNDGLKLTNTYISAAVRCAPPDNKPLPEEKKNCHIYLEKELKTLRKTGLEVIIVLGKLAFEEALRLLAKDYPKPLKKLEFKHGFTHEIGPFHVVCSYHPSQQNTFTGVLTEPMFDQVFKVAKSLLS